MVDFILEAFGKLSDSIGSLNLIEVKKGEKYVFDPKAFSDNPAMREYYNAFRDTHFEIYKKDDEIILRENSDAASPGIRIGGNQLKNTELKLKSGAHIKIVYFNAETYLGYDVLVPKNDIVNDDLPIIESDPVIEKAKSYEKEKKQFIENIESVSKSYGINVSMKELFDTKKLDFFKSYPITFYGKNTEKILLYIDELLRITRKSQREYPLNENIDDNMKILQSEVKNYQGISSIAFRDSSVNQDSVKRDEYATQSLIKKILDQKDGMKRPAIPSWIIASDLYYLTSIDFDVKFKYSPVFKLLIVYHTENGAKKRGITIETPQQSQKIKNRYDLIAGVDTEHSADRLFIKEKSKAIFSDSNLLKIIKKIVYYSPSNILEYGAEFSVICKSKEDILKIDWRKELDSIKKFVYFPERSEIDPHDDIIGLFVLPLVFNNSIKLTIVPDSERLVKNSADSYNETWNSIIEKENRALFDFSVHGTADEKYKEFVNKVRSSNIFFWPGDIQFFSSLLTWIHCHPQGKNLYIRWVSQFKFDYIFHDLFHHVLLKNISSVDEEIEVIEDYIGVLDCMPNPASLKLNHLIIPSYVQSLVQSIENFASFLKDDWDFYWSELEEEVKSFINYNILDISEGDKLTEEFFLRWFTLKIWEVIFYMLKNYKDQYVGFIDLLPVVLLINNFKKSIVKISSLFLKKYLADYEFKNLYDLVYQILYTSIINSLTDGRERKCFDDILSDIKDKKDLIIDRVKNVLIHWMKDSDLHPILSKSHEIESKIFCDSKEDTQSTDAITEDFNNLSSEWRSLRDTIKKKCEGNRRFIWCFIETTNETIIRRDSTASINSSEALSPSVNRIEYNHNMDAFRSEYYTSDSYLPDENYMVGTLISYNGFKGYGFIAHDDYPKNLFFYKDNLKLYPETEHITVLFSLEEVGEKDRAILEKVQSITKKSPHYQSKKAPRYQGDQKSYPFKRKWDGGSFEKRPFKKRRF